VQMIIESSSYGTLTMDELFSKLKAMEMEKLSRARMKGRSDSSSPKSKALVGGSGSCANSSSVGFSLASLVSIIYE